MDLFEAMGQRRSVRAFQPREVPARDLERILEASNQAPSAGDLQAYEIYVVTDPDIRSALARAAYSQDFIAQAPVALVFCTHPARARRYGSRGATLYSIQDATIAGAYAQLAATTLGLSTCWVGAFDEGEAGKAMNLPTGLRPILILPVGLAAETPQPTPRRALSDVVHRL